MERSEASSRLKSPDIFKGIAISFIVVLHLAISSKRDVGDPAPAIQALYLGLVGFFIMSGYFFKPGRGFKENMRRRSRLFLVLLIVAAAVLPMISFLWCSLWGQPTDFDDLVSCMTRTFALERTFVPFDERLPWAICGFSMGYYFLWCMLFAFVIFYAVADRIRDDARLGVLAIAVLLGITIAYRELFDFSLPMYANLSPMAAAFMICGMYLAKFDLVGKVESGAVGNPKWWGLFLGSTAILLVMVHLLPPSIDFDYMNFGKFGGYSAVPYIFEGVLSFVMILYISFFFSKIPVISTVFEKIGEHTMGILLLHVFVAKMALAPFYTFNDVDCLPAEFAGVARLVLSFASLFVSYLICEYGPRMLIRLGILGKDAEGGTIF